MAAETRSNESIWLSLALVAAVALAAQYLPWRAVPVTAAIVFLLSWALTRHPLRDLGLAHRQRPLRFLIWTIACGILANVAARYTLWPLVTLAFGPRDLSYLGPLVGNWDVFWGLMPLIWLSAGPCEELIYRGFIQQRLERTAIGPVGAILITSVIFALNHFTQGFSGLIVTGLVSVFFGVVFRLSGNNLPLLMVIHALWDTVSLAWITASLP